MLFYLLLVVVLLSTIYLVLQIYYLVQWSSIQHPGDSSDQHYFISIIIPARNEEENIQAAVKSALAQNYPKHVFEVIVVDDQSEDATSILFEDVFDPQLRVMRLGERRKTTVQGSKKKALAYGIAHSKGEIICTTDADCILPPNYLQEVNTTFQKQQVDIVSAPIAIHAERKFIEVFQSLDFCATMLVQGGGIQGNFHYLTNGASLSFKKSAYEDVNGYEGLFHLASGDDVFLTHKILKKFPKSIHFLKSKNSIVETHAMPSFSEFMKQRLRWAGKLSKLTSFNLKWIPVIIWNYIIVTAVAIVLALVYEDNTLLIVSLSAILVKWIIDFIMLYNATGFFKKRHQLSYYLPALFVYSFYFVVLGVLSFLPIAQEWKGRWIR